MVHPSDEMLRTENERLRERVAELEGQLQRLRKFVIWLVIGMSNFTDMWRIALWQPTLLKKLLSSIPRNDTTHPSQDDSPTCDMESLLKVLQSPDHRIRAIVCVTLAHLGDPSAVPHLIPLLGERRTLDGINLCDLAGGALRWLGAGELVDAFERVLVHGEMGALERLRPYRQPFIDAFLRALESPNSRHILHALKALKAWDAVEALPRLKSMARWGWFNFPERVHQTIKEAVAHLESIANLPRPADGQGVAENLLRPAVGSEGTTANLPRPAEMPKEAG
ncbi:MAG: hypothetical protein RJAPGHWK_002249 [Candidatus Fervidibacter sp.]